MPREGHVPIIVGLDVEAASLCMWEPVCFKSNKALDEDQEGVAIKGLAVAT
jgi:hypothetical protein